MRSGFSTGLLSTGATASRRMTGKRDGLASRFQPIRPVEGTDGPAAAACTRNAPPRRRTLPHGAGAARR